MPRDLGSIDGIPIRPCIRCGYCCKEARCALSIVVSEGISPEQLPRWPDALLDTRVAVGFIQSKILGSDCPYLREDGEDQYRCGLLDPDSPVDEEMVRDWLSIGVGCSSALNSDRRALDKKLQGAVSS